MGTGEFPAPHAASIPMRYAVLLRDLRLAVPVIDDNFNPEEFATSFGALKGLQVRMVNFEHHLDKIELGMSKLEHRIHAMELHMQQLHHDLDLDLDLADPDPDPADPARPFHPREGRPPAAPEAPHLLALEPPGLPRSSCIAAMRSPGRLVSDPVELASRVLTPAAALGGVQCTL